MFMKAIKFYLLQCHYHFSSIFDGLMAQTKKNNPWFKKQHAKNKRLKESETMKCAPAMGGIKPNWQYRYSESTINRYVYLIHSGKKFNVNPYLKCL